MADDDVALARAFLSGYDNAETCEAVARLIRSGAAFSRSTEFREPFADWLEQRHRRGRRRDFIRDTEVATHVWNAGRGQREAAIADMMERFGLKRRQVINIQRRYRNMRQYL